MKPANLVAAPVDFVIVTALEEERAAVLAQLPDCQPLPPEPQDIRRYDSGRLPIRLAGGRQGDYSIVVMQSRLASERAGAVQGSFAKNENFTEHRLQRAFASLPRSAGRNLRATAAQSH